MPPEFNNAMKGVIQTAPSCKINWKKGKEKKQNKQNKTQKGLGDVERDTGGCCTGWWWVAVPEHRPAPCQGCDRGAAAPDSCAETAPQRSPGAGSAAVSLLRFAKATVTHGAQASWHLPRLSCRAGTGPEPLGKSTGVFPSLSMSFAPGKVLGGAGGLDQLLLHPRLARANTQPRGTCLPVGCF